MYRLLAVLFIATIARGSNINQQEQIQQYSNDRSVVSAFDTLGSSTFGAVPAYGHVPTAGISPTFDHRRTIIMPGTSTFGTSFAPLPYVGASPMMIPQPYETQIYADPVIAQPLMGGIGMNSPYLGSSVYNSPLLGPSMYGMGSSVYGMGSSVYGMGSTMLNPQITTYTPPVVAEPIYQPMMGSAFVEPSYVSAPYVESTFAGPYQRFASPMVRSPVLGTAVFTQPVLLGDEEEHHE